MKIGTDGVLLGAWVTVPEQANTILDIGAGTGIIALQLAQRSAAELIDALEIDENAYEQCVDNFEASPWGDRLFCYHAALQEFTEEMLAEADHFEPYDLIISNPPFFSEDYKTPNTARDVARFTDALPFKELLENIAPLLSEKGIFAVILPYREKESFITLAANEGLFPRRICNVRGSETSEVKRALMEFSFEKIEPVSESLTIEVARHQYTEEYKSLVRDFYLKL